MSEEYGDNFPVSFRVNGWWGGYQCVIRYGNWTYTSEVSDPVDPWMAMALLSEDVILAVHRKDGCFMSLDDLERVTTVRYGDYVLTVSQTRDMLHRLSGRADPYVVLYELTSKMLDKFHGEQR